jgi:membrane protein DedA with SNARE-associated domain
MAADTFADTVIAFLRENQPLAEPIVFILGLAEGLPLISWFVPSSALFLAVGSIQGGLGGGVVRLWIAASAGAVVGDCVTYAIGRILKDEAQNIWPLTRYPGWLPTGKALFERWGVLAVLGGKFLGFMRPLVPIVAGVLQMPVALFFIASVVSSFVWAGAFLVPGWGVAQLAR